MAEQAPMWERDLANLDRAALTIVDDHIELAVADDGFYGVADLSAEDARAFAAALIEAAEQLDGH